MIQGHAFVEWPELASTGGRHDQHYRMCLPVATTSVLAPHAAPKTMDVATRHATLFHFHLRNAAAAGPSNRPSPAWGCYRGLPRRNPHPTAHHSNRTPVTLDMLRVLLELASCSSSISVLRAATTDHKPPYFASKSRCTVQGMHCTVRPSVCAARWSLRWPFFENAFMHVWHP